MDDEKDDTLCSVCGAETTLHWLGDESYRKCSECGNEDY